MTEWASSSCRSILDDRDARSPSETPLPPRLGSRPKLLFQQDCCSGWMVHSVRLASPGSPWELTEGCCQDLSEPWLSLRLSRLERLGSLSEGWNSTVFEQPRRTVRWFCNSCSMLVMVWFSSELFIDGSWSFSSSITG